MPGNEQERRAVGVPPLTGESWCFAHHPERAEERAAAHSAGGRNAHRYIDLEAEPDLDAIYEEMRRGFNADLQDTATNAATKRGFQRDWAADVRPSA